MANCLVPGGKLLLTTPNYNKKPYNKSMMEAGPFLPIEDGRHVRQGYTEKMLRDLCKEANLQVESIDYVSGFLTQKLTALMQIIGKVHPFLGWIIILPFRVFPLVFDKLVTKAMKYPYYSICLTANKK